MDLRQFANVDSFLRDLESQETISWNEYMERIINKIGLHRIKLFIPYGVECIREALKEDEHLNNLPLSSWDRASGYNLNTRFENRGQVVFYHTGFGQFLIDNGINIISLSECICILKEAARMLCEKEK